MDAENRPAGPEFDEYEREKTRMKTTRVVAVLLLAVFAFTGCREKQVGTPAPPEVAGAPAQAPAERTPVRSGYLSVNPTGVKALADAGAVLIDVRQPEELAGGNVIPGAVNIPLGVLPSRVDELDREKTYVMICRSGRRSAQAAAFLSGKGFTHVYNMEGGMNLYERAVAGAAR